MPRYVAFLRAINVGGHIVKMDRLRDLFEELPVKNVETFIASGNVLFDATAKGIATLERKIETHLEQALGYEVATFLRSADEVTAVARYEPFSRNDLDAKANTLYVAFLPSAPGPKVAEKLAAFGSAMEEFHVYQREVYWLLRQRFSDSKFSGALLEKTVGMPATVRNVTTVRRLAAKVAPVSA